MADNVSVLIDFSSGTAGSLITAANLTAGTSNASGITATWSVSRTPQQHTHSVSSTALTLLEPIICGGVTHTATSARAIEYDLDLAVSLGSSPIYEQQTLSFGSNSVGDISLGSMTTFSADAGTEADVFYVYSPFGVMQYHNNSGQGALNAHASVGGPSTAGPHFDIDPGIPYWITQHCSVTGGTVSVVAQDGVTGAFVGCSRALSDPIALTSMLLGDYLVPTGGSFKHSIVTLAFDGLAALPLAPGSFVLPPPASVVATDGDTDISIAFGLKAHVLAFEYRIERTQDLGASWTTLETNYIVTVDGSFTLSLPYTDSTVVNAVTYQYRITALLGIYESVPAYSGYVTHGSAVWHDSLDPAIADTTHNQNDSARIHSVVLTLPDGTVSKLRVYVSSSASGFDVACKMALYDNSGALLTNAATTIFAASSHEWIEVTVPHTNISAGSYRLAWAAQGNSNDVVYSYKNGVGQTDVATDSYVAFPVNPALTTGFSIGGADAVGVFISPTIAILPTIISGMLIY